MNHALNPKQAEAVKYLDGPCLVLAGAGSGKTRVITQKIAYLITDCAYQAKNVCALTFTNKAAKEMSERLKATVNSRFLKGLTVCTFHSLGLRFLREHYSQANLKQNFSILDSSDTLAIFQELLATTDKAHLRLIQQKISLWKNALLSPDQAALQIKTEEDEQAAKVYYSYQATLQAYQAVDFDDLIRIPAQILQTDDDIRRLWQARILYLLVDEYQDTNTCQYQLMKSICGQRAMFTVVGDDDQAIYAWRGATIENLTELKLDYPKLRLIKLEQNYRSVQSILRAANNVISHNPKTFDKTLWSELGVGESIRITPMDNDIAEAESVAMRISAARLERQAQWRDFAVLYRSNHQSRILEQALRNLRIPYIISGDQSFFDKPEIRDILAWLRLIANEDEDPSFIRAATTPKRGIGQNTLQALGEAAAQKGISLYAITQDDLSNILPTSKQQNAIAEFTHLIEYFQRRTLTGSTLDAVKPQHELFTEQTGFTTANSGIDGLTEDSVAQLLDDLLGIINYESYLYNNFDERQAQNKWNNVQELMAWLKRKATEDDLSITEIIQHIALITMLDRASEDDPDAIKLSTLHAAKGLEYPHVFLIGVEEGLIPHQGNLELDDNSPQADLLRQQRVEEERRLMYVGITRAQRSLNLSWCKKRRRSREDVICEPSRFIAEMGIDKIKGSASIESDPEKTLSALRNLLNR